MADADPTPDDQPTGNQEPVVSGYLVTILTLAVSAFGVDVASDGVTKAIAAVAGLVVALASMWLTRDRVTPMTKVTPQLEAAKKDGVATGIAAATTTLTPHNVTLDLTGNDAAQQAIEATMRIAEPAPPPEDDPYLPLPPLPTLRGFASPGLYNEPDDAGVDH